MNYFEFIAIFCAPIFGVTILLNKYRYNWKELLVAYFRMLISVNLITMLVIYVLKEYTYIVYTTSFFIKYSVLGILISIIASLMEISLNKYIKVDLDEKN